MSKTCPECSDPETQLQRPFLGHFAPDDPVSRCRDRLKPASLFDAKSAEDADGKKAVDLNHPGASPHN